MRQLLLRFVAPALLWLVRRIVPDEPLPASGEFDFSTDGYWKDLVDDEDFSRAIQTIARIESTDCVVQMRKELRKGHNLNAAAKDAQALVFEDLPELFRRYARKLKETQKHVARNDGI